MICSGMVTKLSFLNVVFPCIHGPSESSFTSAQDWTNGAVPWCLGVHSGGQGLLAEMVLASGRSAPGRGVLCELLGLRRGRLVCAGVRRGLPYRRHVSGFLLRDLI